VEGGEVVEQAVDTGDTDVVDALDFGAHELGSDGGLLCDGQVGGAAAEHGDAGSASLAAAVDSDGAGGLVVGGVREGGAHGLVRFERGAGDEHAVGAFGEAGGDRGGLVGRLALGEDDLGEGVTEGAVVVDLGEPDVLVGEEAQFFEGGLDAPGA
jgi:hypothetical protein